jgi:hypothetical protein
MVMAGLADQPSVTARALLKDQGRVKGMPKITRALAWTSHAYFSATPRTAMVAQDDFKKEFFG